MDIFVRGAFNYDTDQASLDAGLECLDPSKAIQSQAEETDINYIVKRFGVTGQLPVVPMPPSYADFSESVTDYREAMDLVLAANRSFAALPADVRARFANDAGAFLDFAENPANIDELRKMGLAVPKQENADVSSNAGGGNSEASGSNA